VPWWARADPIAAPYTSRMISRTIAQVVVGDGGIVASSEHFDEAWRPQIEGIVDRFGLPPGAMGAACLFAVPMGRRHVAVVSVSGRRFRFLILLRELYRLIPDPFAIAERFPPTWDGPLDALEWPPEPLPKRTIAQLDQIFKQGDGPLLLGACQTLVDSGRIAFRRDEPLPALCRDLWNLLPESTRRVTWPATFAYSTVLGFSLVVLDKAGEEPIPGYLTEDQARDYPESRYERELQIAVEAGDQRTVDNLLGRRSSAETLRLAIWMVLGATVLAIVARLLMR
jgi:hypothetical protein